MAGAKVQLKLTLIRATELTPPPLTGKRRGFGNHQLRIKHQLSPLRHLQPVLVRDRSRPFETAVPCIMPAESSPLVLL
jgi:hypothetical protein